MIDPVDIGSCPEHCPHIEAVYHGWCLKYSKRLYRSAFTNKIIRLPRCIMDDAKNKQAGRS